MTIRLDARVHDVTGRGACVAFAWVNALLAINPLTRWPGDIMPGTWALHAHQRILEHRARGDGTQGPINPLHGARIHQAAGLIDRYDKARNVDQVVAALELGPVVAGLPWYTGMDRLTDDHQARPVGSRRGLHAVALTDRHGDRITLRNSHGTAYGDRGDAWISIDDLADLVPLGCVVSFR